MAQPVGFKDDLGQVCLLVKSIYGLKQAGRVWNIKFNLAMQKYGYKPLILDPCTYILHQGEDFIIITIWVDDLLLFGTLDKLIEQIVA